ncbi:MAG: apolipoprotein N-acyltransferase [Candidatus Omnitrophica bacterium]|nr:apolipoprotein N-acyltransferase [Candidatus Omnitrophota bacterium]
MLRKIKSLSFLLSIISGVGIGLAFLFPKFSFLVWFSLVPLFFILQKKTSLKGFISFFIFGFVYYGLSLYWVTYVSILGFVLLIVYLSLFYLIFYLLGAFFIRRPLRQLAIPAAWVVVEFLKEIIWCGFSWANLGYSQFNNLYLIQVADIGGTKLISFVIVLVNFLIWEIIISYKKKAKKPTILKKLISLLLIFTVLGAYSFFRFNKNSKLKEKLDITLIQPNILDKQLMGPEDKNEVLNDLLVMAKKAPQDNLVIFPEAAWPYLLDKEDTQLISNFTSSSKRDILIGAITKEGKKYYNSALFLNRKGSLIKAYDKIKLVPFGEYVPFRKYLKFIKVLNSIGDITPGSQEKGFSYQGKDFSVLICFEDLFPDYVAEAAENKDFLVNITDDSWFLGEPEASQHLSIMALRAVENRISIIRSANSGISGWVSFQGDITKLKKDKKSLFIRGKGDFKVLINNKRSFYNKRRGWFVLFSFLLLIAVFLKDMLNLRLNEKVDLR